MGVVESSLDTDNKHFYETSLFPHFEQLILNHEIIAQELKRALLTKVVQPDEENGARLSGVWCGNSTMDEFFSKNKGKEGWLHWWSVDDDRPHESWTVFPLILKGEFATENCKLLPETSRLLSQVEGIRVAGFSRLKPKSSIDPHFGFTGRRYGALAFHLGLVIPFFGCSLKVGPKKHEWTQPGQAIIFDDTYLHSARNDSNEERIILYIDFLIPEDVIPKLPEMSPVPSDTEDNYDDEGEEQEEVDEQEEKADRSEEDI